MSLRVIFCCHTKHIEILSDATIFYLTTSNVLKCFGINTGSRLGTGNLNPIEKPPPPENKDTNVKFFLELFIKFFIKKWNNIHTLLLN